MIYEVKRGSKKLPLVIMIIILAALFCIFGAADFINPPVIGHLIFFLYAAFICWYVLRFVCSGFIYKLKDDTLIIIKKQGGRENEILKIPVSDIIFIGKRKSKKIKRDFFVIFANNVTSRLFPKNSYIVVYRDGEYMRKLKIEPAKEILRSISDIVPDKVRIGYMGN